MKSTGPAQLDEARNLLVREVASCPDPEAAAQRIYDRLLLHLAPLIGAEGVKTLVLRSAQLEKAEHPCFEGLSVHRATEDPEKAGERLRTCLQEQAHPAARAATVALFTRFFSLLALFIGERLTAQILHRAWPASEPPGPAKRKR